MRTLTAEQSSRQLSFIQEWLSVFIAPEQVTELRALGVGNHRCVSQFFTGKQLRLMAEAAVTMERAGAKGVYFTPNPLRPDVLHSRLAAKDADVLRRRWLLIDVDSKRESGQCATLAQKQAAYAVAEACLGSLEAYHLRQWVLSDSGNGYHVYVPVDLPNDDASRDLHKHLLKGLHKRCGTEAAGVDSTTYNAARIMRVPGTLCRKGEGSPERPHRWSKLLRQELQGAA